jgi:hypothetical protein
MHVAVHCVQHLVSSVLFSGILADFILSPTSVTVGELDSVTISCQTTTGKSVDWFKRNAYWYRRLWNPNSVCSTDFQVKSGNGFFNLTLSNIQPDDAGEYACIESEEFRRHIAVARLTVVSK